MSFVICIFMALMAAGVTGILVRVLRRGKTACAIVVLLPLLSLAIYMSGGRPDLPATSALTATGLAERHLVMLAERPMETLAKNPRDLGALMSMAEISGRLGQTKDQKEFLRRAVAEAKASDDVRLEQLQAQLKNL